MVSTQVSYVENASTFCQRSITQLQASHLLKRPPDLTSLYRYGIPEPAVAKHPPTFLASLPAIRNFSQEYSLHEGLPILPCQSLRFWALR